MASIEKRTGKRGTSYRITVTVGCDASGKLLKHYKTYTPPETWGEAKAEREAQRQACVFEEEIKKGFALDNRQTFEEYSAYVIELKRRQGVKESTLERYNAMLAQIFPEIGYLKLSDIRPAHLNNLYTKLSKSGGRQDKGTATARTDIKAVIKAQKLTRTEVAQRAGVSPPVRCGKRLRRPSAAIPQRRLRRCSERSRKRSSPLSGTNRRLPLRRFWSTTG